MHNSEARRRKERQKEQIKQRYNMVIDPENYEYIPAKKQADYYDNDVNQRVAIYVRVSTDDVRQTTSYELQKKYYEEFVTRHPNWTLVNIYADEGISGTSLKHRDEFNRMIADCKAGKIDMIVTKSVSRFARNVEDFIGTVRSLAERRPPVGVFFESEAIFSLNDDSQMALTFQATMAEEESHTRSRSMETSLRMRLDHGVPLTPKLFGYTHDEDGHLQINPDEAPTVKLIFYMYLYGYSAQQIADTLTNQARSTYFGKSCWSSSGIVSILRNERHCGDVLTRKTVTENYRTHRTLKNRGEKPQSRYYNHHDAIIRRDDFNAVQRMLDNAKYGNKSILPELRVIHDGLLKGFVSINPRWSGFKEGDYLSASRSAYTDIPTDGAPSQIPADATFAVNAGDFDLRGFEITRTEFLGTHSQPFVTFADKKVKFSAACVRHFGAKRYVELLINVFNGQHTIEIVALVSGSRDTPVWCMIYDELVYEHEADIFANQQKFVKRLSPYEVFTANLEAGNDDQLIIRDLLESYGLSLGTRKAPCVICAVSTLEQIYQTHGYHMLSRVLRLCAGTWEGDENSFSANILNGITRLVYTFGDQLNDEVFKERVGALSIKQLVRMSKERCPGSMGYAEAMLLEYNGKKKNISQRLSMNKLHMQRTAGLCSLLSDVDTSPEAATAEGVSE